MFDIPHLLRAALSTETARLRVGLIRLAVALVMIVTAGLAATIGVVFLLFGAYQSLSQWLPAWQAGGLVAFAVLPLVGLLLLAAWRPAAHRRPPRPASRPRSARDSDEIRDAVEHGLRAGDALRRSGTGSTELLLAAFIAGLVLSRSTRPQKSQKADDSVDRK